MTKLSTMILAMFWMGSSSLEMLSWHLFELGCYITSSSWQEVGSSMNSYI